MRRILLVLTAAALMAAMVLAMVVPAFADPGGEVGHSTSTGDFAFVNCNPFEKPCTGESTYAGPGAFLDSEGNTGSGRFVTDTTVDLTDLSQPRIDVSQDSQGGGPGIGGGNCTTTSDGHTQTTEGVGTRC